MLSKSLLEYCSGIEPIMASKNFTTASPKAIVGKVETPDTRRERRAPTGLTWSQERFCLEYVLDHNAARAARTAGYSEKTAQQQGYDLLTNPYIRQRISGLERAAAEKLQIEHHDLLKRLWDTATGDVNDLVRVERRCCRFCHGAGHEYQWRTEREYRRAVDAFLDEKSGGDTQALIALGDRIDAGGRIPSMPENSGGFGFDATAAPHPDCPECHGEGIATVHAADTREALAHPLYDGVKQTKDGIEIKIADRSKALERVARHLAFFNDKVEIGASEELLQAARNINAASPALDANYMAEHAYRLASD